MTFLQVLQGEGGAGNGLVIADCDGGDSGCRDCRRVGLGDMGSRVLTSRHLLTLGLAGPSWKGGHEGVWREGGWVVSRGVCPRESRKLYGHH